LKTSLTYLASKLLNNLDISKNCFIYAVNLYYSIKLIATSPVTDPILCHYLEARNIPVEIAKNYCRQITYLNGQKQFYAIGFKNNSGGFELRAPNFKSTISPKDFTFLNSQKWDAVAVFEGFTDFLSLIASGQQMLPELTNFLVLNSLSFFEKARPAMEQHERIYLLLDNDAAGKNCTKNAMALSYKYNDLSDKYQQGKDINEWLMKEKESEQHSVHGVEEGCKFLGASYVSPSSKRWLSFIRRADS
jgi:hypothetical protein